MTYGMCYERVQSAESSLQRPECRDRIPSGIVGSGCGLARSHLPDKPGSCLNELNALAQLHRPWADEAVVHLYQHLYLVYVVK